MPPLGFELTITASERPQTHALDRAATGIGTEQSAYYFSSHVCHVASTSIFPWFDRPNNKRRRILGIKKAKIYTYDDIHTLFIKLQVNIWVYIKSKQAPISMTLTYYAP
jgi:hypothetical protein